uniref:Chemosensory protein 12 n=1 Tax=Chrysopa pallens TaxID=417485 RepID=A0A0R8PDM8_CHRPA|nr:chemosensory protein 12 [Chrysopa pallens]
MKLTIIVSVIVLTITIVYAQQESYPTKFDNIDVNAILSNERLLNNYIDCLEEKGKCTPEGEELKKHFEDAIKTCCKKCSPKQKDGFKKVFNHLEKEKPEVLKRLKQKFDPSGSHEIECRKQLA